MGITTIEVPAEFVGPFRGYAADELRSAGDHIEGGAATLAESAPDEVPSTLGELGEAAAYPPHVVKVLAQLRSHAGGPTTIKAQGAVLKEIAGNAMWSLGERLHTLTFELSPVHEIE